MSIVLLAAGGGLGAAARYLTGLLLMRFIKKPVIPAASLVVNLIGAIGLGFFLGIRYQMVPAVVPHEPLYLLVVIGFFGAFTTFSTFSMEAKELISTRKYVGFSLYLLLSIGGSILLFVIGLSAGVVIGF